VRLVGQEGDVVDGPAGGESLTVRHGSSGGAFTAGEQQSEVAPGDVGDGEGALDCRVKLKRVV
jgi:hypothetical protein